MNPIVFYFHGFASSADSTKIAALREHFAERDISFVAETYNTYDPKIAHQQISTLIAENLSAGQMPIFSGTSLGSFWATYFAGKHRGYIVLANPSLFPLESLSKYVQSNGRYSSFAGEEFAFTQQMVDGYSNYPLESKPAGGLVLLNAGDELIAHSFPRVEQLLQDVANIKHLQGGNHRFENVEDLVAGFGLVIGSIQKQQIKIAVIGSRSFDDYELLANSLKETTGSYEITTVISGGAKGADSLAEKYAAENNLQTMILKPDWKKYGRGAGVIRNKDIVENSDYVLAFWDGSSKGTQNSINHARKMNKPIKVIKY